MGGQAELSSLPISIRIISKMSLLVRRAITPLLRNMRHSSSAPKGRYPREKNYEQGKPFNIPGLKGEKYELWPLFAATIVGAGWATYYVIRLACGSEVTWLKWQEKNDFEPWQNYYGKKLKFYSTPSEAHAIEALNKDGAEHKNMATLSRELNDKCTMELKGIDNRYSRQGVDSNQNVGFNH